MRGARSPVEVARNSTQFRPHACHVTVPGGGTAQANKRESRVPMKVAQNSARFRPRACHVTGVAARALDPLLPAEERELGDRRNHDQRPREGVAESPVELW